MMTRLVRPHVPLSVRLEVIARQLQRDGKLMAVLTVSVLTMKNSDRLAYLLKAMFGDQPYELDHDPCLALRYRDDETGEYDPPANSAEHLVYRLRDEHKTKTRIRGDHGQFSDLALIRREKRWNAKRIGKARPAKHSRADLSGVQLGAARQGSHGKPAGAQPEGVVPALPRSNRWPKGRKMQSRPFLKVIR
jgi:hypothetical protein